MTQQEEHNQSLLSQIYGVQSKGWIITRSREVLSEIAHLKEEVRRHPNNPDLYASMAKLQRESGDDEAAEATLRGGIAECPSATYLYWQLASILRESGQTEKTVALASSAIRRAPKGIQFRFLERLTLPVIYDTEEQVVAWRRQFIRGLKTCETEISTASRETLEAFLEGLKHFTNFYLPYQGYNDVALQRRYGKLVHHVMKAHYPQWTNPLLTPDLAPGGKVRVGYASSFLCKHTVARVFLGWLEKFDRKRFQIHTYYSGRPEDTLTQHVREVSDVFFHIADDFEALCRQIRKDQLHVLIFMDIGMAPETTMLAALRLAPVQCMAWGHPVTSGLPTVDYFLSSELMEPRGCKRHYAEQLVLLPGIGICVDKPFVPRALLTKRRSVWGIPEDAVVYLCCQSLFKYLPPHDHIFAAIARRVAKAKFVFLSHERLLIPRFQARLQRAFSSRGLNFDDYCAILPMQHQFDYWNLNLVSDIFLDSLSWSGGMTCLDALACGLPVVTLPGEFMRGRHSYAILTQLGMTDTIASSESEYIDIAVQLGKRPEWRRALAKRIAEHEVKLFSDERSVEALQGFFERVVLPPRGGPHERSKRN